MTIKLALAEIVTAFSHKAIGSKVLLGHEHKFIEGLDSAIQGYDTSQDDEPGQHFIVCPELIPHVSAGDGPSSNNPDDYVIRNTPGRENERPKMFLKREKAGEVNFLACVVYTIEAYIADPEVTGEELAHFKRAVEACAYTHVLVAVIASSGPRSPLTPYRFVSNLAGGNNEALKWDADKIRAKAAEIKDHWSNWSVVAD
jgi:hypothetical protein